MHSPCHPFSFLAVIWGGAGRCSGVMLHQPWVFSAPTCAHLPLFPSCRRSGSNLSGASEGHPEDWNLEDSVSWLGRVGGMVLAGWTQRRGGGEGTLLCGMLLWCSGVSFVSHGWGRDVNSHWHPKHSHEGSRKMFGDNCAPVSLGNRLPAMLLRYLLSCGCCSCWVWLGPA